MRVGTNEFLLEGAHGIFSRVIPCELQRILSNLINNSVEVIGDSGNIKVSLSCESGSAFIRILDNGKGIPPDVLKELGNVERTYDKEGGSGQGVFPAKKMIESWGGMFSISSEVGCGTCVEIRLPVAPPPPWFAETIELKSRIVILDDDPTIHDVWNDRFFSMGLTENGIEGVHFYDPPSLEKWYRSQTDPNAIFLIDYELIGSKETGLDVVERLGVSSTPFWLPAATMSRMWWIDVLN